MALERFANGTWLTPPLITFTGLAMIAGTVVALGMLFLTGHGTVDAFGRPLGTDFSSFWTAGRMALEGHAAAAYDWPSHMQFQLQTHGVELFFPWSYPPIFLLVAAALATLPYLASLAVWQGLSLLASFAALRAILPGRQAVLMGLGFPAVLICLGHGQTGFLTAALLAGGLAALPRREVVAGILFGLLAYKPQFGLLLPIVLAVGGHWRAIFAAAATVLVTCGAAWLAWGWPVWQAFLDSIPLTRTIVLEPDSASFEKFQSAFAWMRLWGEPLAVAYGLQAAVTAAALVGCVWAWRGEASFRLKAAALLTGTLLSSPYVLDYDFVVLGMALAFFVAEGLQSGFRPWEKTVLALAWITPVAAREIAKVLYLPLGLFMLAVLFALILMRIRAESQESHAIGARPAAMIEKGTAAA